MNLQEFLKAKRAFGDHGRRADWKGERQARVLRESQCECVCECFSSSALLWAFPRRHQAQLTCTLTVLAAFKAASAASSFFCSAATVALSSRTRSSSA